MQSGAAMMNLHEGGGDAFICLFYKGRLRLCLQRTNELIFYFRGTIFCFMFLLRFSLVSHVFFLCFILLQSIVSPRLIEFPFPGQFTEDGSFIGQYVPGKLQPPVSPLPIAHSSQGGGAAPSPTGAPGMHSNSAATYV